MDGLVRSRVQCIPKNTWMPAREWERNHTGANREMAAVLLVTGSLTRFLERHYRMHLTLKLHDQLMGCCIADEAKIIGVETNMPALRRRVSLLHHGSVMFDAESVLPLETLPVKMIEGLEEGKVPLGNLLLDYGLSLSRSDLSIAMGVEEGLPFWGRQSVLKSGSGATALVVESFHKKMWRDLNLLIQRRT
ncbi:MAG: chorismate lyase [Mariprofundaceae bacterium]